MSAERVGRQLRSAGVPVRPQAAAMLHRAPAIARIDDLRAALFGPEESVKD